MLQELIKIPLLLSTTWGWYICSTPPRPPAKKDEVVSGSMAGDFIARILKLSLVISNSLEILAILIHLFGPHLHLQLPVPHAITPAFLLGWTCLIIATLIRQKCYQTLGRHFTFEISLQAEHRLVTTGPYGVVRHPAYAAGVLGCFGVMLSLSDALSLRGGVGGGGGWDIVRIVMLVRRATFYLWLLCAISGVVVSVRRTRIEDAVLENEFGDEWREWRSRVGWRILPWIY